MDIDVHGFCLLCQITPIHISSDHPLVVMSPFDVQLSGDLSTDRSDRRIAIHERGKFRPVYGSENG
jgi:hypothetical protein